MNQFGGNWTEQKIEIVVDYAKAYLTIMNKFPQFKTLYFDGFAGSGEILKENETDIEIIKGTAIRVLEIVTPKKFDRYYFVEKDENNKVELERTINAKFSNRTYNVVNEDCNSKLLSMAEFLKKNRNYRVLAFVDPYGMSVNWSSIEALRGLGVDLWILVPTGIGVNRLLKNDGNIPKAWLDKLEVFLGIDSNTIVNAFYKKYKQQYLFSEEEKVIYIKGDAINKVHKLYKERLQTVFKYVSEPFVMRNSTNSIMYHFMMSTNNAVALNIANDVVRKYKL
ncbi:MAG: tcmP [Segetibacter sp.]|nr:tcmP [Segetibacter sp.]